jgi:DNA-binding MarR family transcriptional regulator
MSEEPSGEQLNADELSAWRGLLRVHARMTRALDEELVATHSLNLPAYEVLLYLEDAPDGRLRMAELADTVLLSRDGRARLVERLEEGGLARSDAADLADSVLLSRSGLTRIVERLEQRGLVRRESLPSEPSGSHAVLTESGRATLAEARKTHLSGVRRRFLQRFSVEEQRIMGSYYDRALDWMEQEEGLG